MRSDMTDAGVAGEWSEGARACGRRSKTDPGRGVPGAADARNAVAACAGVRGRSDLRAVAGSQTGSGVRAYRESDSVSGSHPASDSGSSSLSPVPYPSRARKSSAGRCALASSRERWIRWSRSPSPAMPQSSSTPTCTGLRRLVSRLADATLRRRSRTSMRLPAPPDAIRSPIAVTHQPSCVGAASSPSPAILRRIRVSEMTFCML